jgi:hypothetical protein
MKHHRPIAGRSHEEREPCLGNDSTNSISFGATTTPILVRVNPSNSRCKASLAT